MAKRHEVRLTQDAEADLRSIIRYVARHGSREAAAMLLEKFVDRIDQLATFPLRGSVPKELDPLGIAEFRQIVVPPYRIIYRIEGARVSVMLIADGRRDMQTLLERRLLSR